MVTGEPTEPYARFAPYYDAFYADLVDHDGDVAILEDLFRDVATREVEHVLDLGCGTGTHALLLARRGYRVTGQDASKAMVEVAEGKRRDHPDLAHRLAFHVGDFTRSLPEGMVDAVTLLFGPFIYVHDDADARQLLRLIHEHLAPGGVLAFTFWNVQAVDPERLSWYHVELPDGREILRYNESHFDVTTNELTMPFQFLVIDGDRVVERFTDTHVARMRTIREVRELLEEAGFTVVTMAQGHRDGKSLDPADHRTMRVLAVARKDG